MTQAMDSRAARAGPDADRVQPGPVLGRRAALLRPVRGAQRFCESGRALELASALDRRLGEVNIEYASKRSSLRLASVRPQLLAPGTWHQWDRQRLAQSGGTPEQYKHPCLIPDLGFRATMPVETELTTRCHGFGE